MKFLLDANIPHSAKDVFRKPHTVFHVRDIGFAEAADEEIITWAQKHRAVLVTRDLDFGNILHFPPERYTGIVILKIPHFYGASAIIRIIRGFLKVRPMPSCKGKIIILEEGRMRIRE